MIERATDIADKLLHVLAHHVLPILLTGKKFLAGDSQKQLYTVTSAGKTCQNYKNNIYTTASTGKDVKIITHKIYTMQHLPV